MQNVVLIIHLLLAISLIGLVLLQRSEGGGLGMGQGGANKGNRQTPGQLGQSRGRRATGHRPTASTAAAHTKAATFRALQQNQANQRDGQKKVDDQDDILHTKFPIQVRGYLSKDNSFAKSKLRHRPHMALHGPRSELVPGFAL